MKNCLAGTITPPRDGLDAEYLDRRPKLHRIQLAENRLQTPAASICSRTAESTLYFYLGRIAGQPTAAQMKAALDQQGKTITDANAGTLMGDCVKPVSAKVQILRTLAAQSPSAAAPAPQAKPPVQPQGR